MSGSVREAEERLLAEVSGLPVDEILALCYSLRNTPQRLRLYLDVLRRRGGERAQFASCLICFDLARQGDETAQREFGFLSDTIRQLASNQQLVGSLVGEDDYLVFIWELCQAQLDEMDPRFEGDEVLPVVEPDETLAELDLLSDADFGENDFTLTVDTSEMWRRFDEAVEAFLGGQVGLPVYDPTAGFRVSNNRDVQRVERFLQELDSLRELVPLARGFRAVTMLFYGMHMRAKSLFGAVNQRKQALLREGLDEFLRSGPDMAEIAGVMSPLHAGPEVWEKIAEVIVDYTAWLAESPDHLRLGPNGYDAVERMAERLPRAGNRRAGMRT